MTYTIAQTDTELKTDVLAELKYEPGIKVTDIGVLVKDGTVTLNGYATSYMEKGEAVRAAKRVAGVKAIADGNFDPMETAGAEGVQPDYYFTVMRQNLTHLETAFGSQATQSLLPNQRPSRLFVSAVSTNLL